MNTYRICWKRVDVRYRDIEADDVVTALNIAKKDSDNYDASDSYDDEFVCVEEIDED